jgi:general secretion pathway protein B
VSSILDALKKSEADRQRAAGPTLLDLRVQPSKRSLPAWVVALGVLLAGNAVLLGWLALRRAPAPAAAATETAGASSSLPAQAQATAPTPPSPATAAPPSTLGTATTAQAAVQPGFQGGLQPGLVPGARGAQQGAADADENPADEAPAIEPAPRRSRAGNSGSPKNYSALSANLPPMHLDLHFWSDVPAERYALINLHRVGEGDALPDGTRVLEITREGVVMEYEGREFVLGRE